MTSELITSKIEEATKKSMEKIKPLLELDNKIKESENYTKNLKNDFKIEYSKLDKLSKNYFDLSISEDKSKKQKFKK